MSKLKNHWIAGVTMTLKNNFGNTPCSLYGGDCGESGNENPRQERGPVCHNGKLTPPKGVPQELDMTTPRDPGYRIPRIVADLVGAREELRLRGRGVYGGHGLRPAGRPWHKAFHPRRQRNQARPGGGNRLGGPEADRSSGLVHPGSPLRLWPRPHRPNRLSPDKPPATGQPAAKVREP
jgi:hypothetical protein